ncbi:MAG: hypothetical protein B6D44_00560 [Ignavibacteriales bacterium UTCHB2]|jgi:glycosyltransferase involved in cell wall biosynthesis|nr:MAG: hypothetical protein B6D44_00560 [Ignavibacteriales bacterium UTCHB2]
MNITVGIGTLNRYYYLIKTIEYVIAQQHPAVCEIIVVDQSDSDVIEPRENNVLQGWNDSGKIIWLKSEKKNLPAARNLILQKAKGDIIIFLDDDVILPSGFIEAHFKHHLKYSFPIVVAGLNYDRKTNFRFEDLNLENFQGNTITRQDFKLYNESFNNFIGANHSINKKLATLEGYDENFIGYGEDTDMAKRILKLKRGKIICEPEAWLIHLRAPAGGCRVTDNKIKRKENEIVGPFFLFAIRHLVGKEKWNAYIKTFRVGPLRKENVVKFWRQFFVWFQYAYAFYWACKNRNKIKSPFVKN